MPFTTDETFHLFPWWGWFLLLVPRGTLAFGLRLSYAHSTDYIDFGKAGKVSGDVDDRL